jgi:hypothetical protein
MIRTARQLKALSSQYVQKRQQQGYDHHTQLCHGMVSGTACRFPIDEIENSSALQSLWENYRTSFDYAADIQWETIIRAFRQMYDMAVPPG